jgi:hypothetical protein
MTLELGRSDHFDSRAIRSCASHDRENIVGVMEGIFLRKTALELVRQSANSGGA